MARIPGIEDDEAGLIRKMVYRGAAQRTGRVPDPLRIMAHSSGTMWGAGLFEIAFGRAASVDPKLKSLACLKAASMIGCVF